MPVTMTQDEAKHPKPRRPSSLQDTLSYYDISCRSLQHSVHSNRLGLLSLGDFDGRDRLLGLRSCRLGGLALGSDRDLDGGGVGIDGEGLALLGLGLLGRALRQGGRGDDKLGNVGLRSV